MRIDIGKDAQRLLEMMNTIDLALETWGHNINEIDEAIAKKELWDDIYEQVQMLASIPEDDTKIVFYGSTIEAVHWITKHGINPQRVILASTPERLQGLNHIPTTIMAPELTVEPMEVEKYRQTDEQIAYLRRLYSKEA